MRLGHSSRKRWIASQGGASLFVISLDRARRLGEGLELRANPSAMAMTVPDQPVHLPRCLAIVGILIVVAEVGLIPVVMS